MIEAIRKWLDDWAAARMRERGYEPILAASIVPCAEELRDTAEYMASSGHFATVSGRTPRATKRVMGSLLNMSDALAQARYEPTS